MEQLRKFSKNIITRVFDWQNFLNLEMEEEELRMWLLFNWIWKFYLGGKMSNFKFILRKINIPILI